MRSAFDNHPDAIALADALRYKTEESWRPCMSSTTPAQHLSKPRHVAEDATNLLYTCIWSTPYQSIIHITCQHLTDRSNCKKKCRIRNNTRQASLHRPCMSSITPAQHPSKPQASSKEQGSKRPVNPCIVHRCLLGILCLYAQESTKHARAHRQKPVLNRAAGQTGARPSLFYKPAAALC